MFRIENLAEFNAGLDGWFASCALLANEAFKGLSWAAFDFVARGTPQWSGNLAGSWTMSVGAPDLTVRPKPDMGVSSWGAESPLHVGSPEAVAVAKAVARPKLAGVTLATTVFITNPSPYASEVQADRGPTGKRLREVNHPIEMVEQAAAGRVDYGPELSEAVILKYAKGTL